MAERAEFLFEKRILRALSFHLSALRVKRF